MSDKEENQKKVEIHWKVYFNFFCIMGMLAARTWAIQPAGYNLAVILGWLVVIANLLLWWKKRSEILNTTLFTAGLIIALPMLKTYVLYSFIVLGVCFAVDSLIFGFTKK